MFGSKDGSTATATMGIVAIVEAAENRRYNHFQSVKAHDALVGDPAFVGSFACRCSLSDSISGENTRSATRQRRASKEKSCSNFGRNTSRVTASTGLTYWEHR